VALTVSGFACPATALLDTALTPAFTGGELPRNVDSHVFTDVALTVSGFACAATALLDTALTPAFTGGELTLD